MFAWAVTLFLGFDIWLSSETHYIGMLFASYTMMAVILFFLGFSRKYNICCQKVRGLQQVLKLFWGMLALIFIHQFLTALFFLSRILPGDLYINFIEIGEIIIFCSVLISTVSLGFVRAWQDLITRQLLWASIFLSLYFGGACTGYFYSIFLYRNWGVVGLVAMFFLMRAVEYATHREIQRVYVSDGGVC